MFIESHFDGDLENKLIHTIPVEIVREHWLKQSRCVVEQAKP
jgi:hypothetical protein